MADPEDYPPCGLYRTTTRLGDIPPGKLVYFHNHGDPSPGVYLPREWRQNRVVFHDDGVMVPGAWWAATLDPLSPEGFYRVREAFACCDKNCRSFVVDQLLQLGYNADAEPVLFVPEVIDGALVVPDEGNRIDRSRITHMVPLKTPVSRSDGRSLQ